LRNAPATERELNVLRTALDLTFGFALRVALAVEVNGDLWPAALVAGVRTAEDRLTRELGRAAERDIAGLALM
jgi:hypothetical protein